MTKKTQIFTMLLLAFFTIGGLSSCNTMSGAGQDIEHAGEAVQDAAN